LTAQEISQINLLYPISSVLVSVSTASKASHSCSCLSHSCPLTATVYDEWRPDSATEINDRPLASCWWSWGVGALLVDITLDLRGRRITSHGCLPTSSHPLIAVNNLATFMDLFLLPPPQKPTEFEYLFTRVILYYSYFAIS
jgi:hypothetical protein